MVSCFWVHRLREFHPQHNGCQINFSRWPPGQSFPKSKCCLPVCASHCGRLIQIETAFVMLQKINGRDAEFHIRISDTQPVS